MAYTRPRIGGTASPPSPLSGMGGGKPDINQAIQAQRAQLGGVRRVPRLGVRAGGSGMPATGGVSMGGAMPSPTTASKVPGGDTRGVIGTPDVGNAGTVSKPAMRPGSDFGPPPMLDGGPTPVGDGAGWMKPPMDISPPTQMTGSELPTTFDPTGATQSFTSPSGPIMDPTQAPQAVPDWFVQGEGAAGRPTDAAAYNQWVQNFGPGTAADHGQYGTASRPPGQAPPQPDGGTQTQYGPPQSPQSPFMGRGGAQQSMGNGRYGGAPPEQVIAQRRAALQRRMQALQPWNG